MRFKLRRTRYFGPIRITVNQSGRVTWGLRIWRWSWNPRTGQHTFDTPGPGSVSFGGRRKQERR